MPDIFLLYVDIWTLPCFENAEIPENCLTMWVEKYKDYRREMYEAMQSNDESKHSCADDIIKKYKQVNLTLNAEQ